MAHPQLGNHLEHLANIATDNYHFNKSFDHNEIVANHDLVHEDNHEHILGYLEAYLNKQPHLAKSLAGKIIKICDQVLQSDEHEYHHEHAQILKEKTWEFHDRVSQTLKNPESSFEAQLRIEVKGKSAQDAVEYITKIRAADVIESKKNAQEFSDIMNRSIQNIEMGIEGDAMKLLFNEGQPLN